MNQANGRMQLFDDEGDDGRAVWIDLNRESAVAPANTRPRKRFLTPFHFPVKTIVSRVGFLDFDQENLCFW